jgi:ribosomal protein S18 acetylase RimI-like enzyme
VESFDLDLILRPAVATDVPAVARIWREGWRDGHLGHVPETLVAVRTEASFDERAAARLGDTTIAAARGRVAGFVMVEGDEVEQVYVDRAHRGSGVAVALLVEAERQVAAAGFAEAWLAVAAGNARARRFYERSGWQDRGPFDHPAPGPDGPIPVRCHRYVRRVG